MDTSVFKAYDIRGIYPSQINEKMAYTIGQSYGSYLQEKLNKNKCVIGMDNRLSSPSLKNALVKGLLASGLNVIDHGLITTPMHYFGRYLENTYGIMITASHNPKNENGFKFSFDHLANARGQMIEDFKNYTLNNQFLTGNGFYEQRSIKDQYLKYMQENIHMGKRSLKVVIDPGNGVTTTIVKDIMHIFPNLDVTYICDQNDGTFPNHHPDPAVEENMTMLKSKVKEIHADLGIAYDGDGDRLGIVDELGNFIMADKVMIFIIKNLLSTFPKKTILCDVKCSKALIDEVTKLGGQIYMCRTGTSFTQAATKENNFSFGGELSGHLFFNDRAVEICSGIYGGLRILEILSHSKQTFSSYLKDISLYESSKEIKIPCPNEKKFQVVEQMKAEIIQRNLSYTDIDGIRFTTTNAWGLIRASNTGPNLTLRFEANTKENLNKIEKEFTDLVLTKIT